jgi:hypothetical protein
VAGGVPEIVGGRFVDAAKAGWQIASTSNNRALTGDLAPGINGKFIARALRRNRPMRLHALVSPQFFLLCAGVGDASQHQ